MVGDGKVTMWVGIGSQIGEQRLHTGSRIGTHSDPIGKRNLWEVSHNEMLFERGFDSPNGKILAQQGLAKFVHRYLSNMVLRPIVSRVQPSISTAICRSWIILASFHSI